VQEQVLVREQEQVLVQEQEQVLVEEQVLVQEQVPVLVRELHTQPDCLPVSLLILRQILISCSIHPPFVKF
jgi:hypothetical protein